MDRAVGGMTSSRGRGTELLLSIGHQPGAVDKLTVVVLKARNLPSSTTYDVTDGCFPSSLTGASTFEKMRTTVLFKNNVKVTFFDFQKKRIT